MPILKPLDPELFPDPTLCRPPLKPSEAGGWELEVKLAEFQKPFDFADLFGRSAPVEVEVGCGSGLYLAQYAALHPERNFLGIEWDFKQVRRSADKWRRRGLLNTRMLHCDAHYFLEDYPAEASVDGYTVLYSDPWFKKRHHKRRFFQPRLLPILEKTMKPGATLLIKTDVTAYYEVMVELFRDAAFLECEFDRRLDLEPDPEDLPTNFQSKALEKGHPIHHLRFRRR